MNIQSTRARMVALQTGAQPQHPPSQPPAQQDQGQPRDSFKVHFSNALETTVPLYTSFALGAWGGVGGLVGGAVIGGVVGGWVGAGLGGLAGGLGAGYLGKEAGAKFGRWAMQRSGDIGASHTPENPSQGKAVGQTVAASAITFFTGTPAMTALVVGGSALYAAHQSAAQG